MSVNDVDAWTDSMVVLSWLSGNPQRFKTYVGNRIAQIVNRIPSEQWKHVSGTDNPADCASRGLFPSVLVSHELWWNGPAWLISPPWEWPNQSPLTVDCSVISDESVCHIAAETSIKSTCVVSLDHYSSFEHLQRIIAWIIRFVHNCQPRKFERHSLSYLTASELCFAETYLCTIIQTDHFSMEINCVQPLPKGNCLLPPSSLLDSNGLLRVGGRQRHSKLSYSKVHPVILHVKHPITRLIILSEHKRLLHAGPALMMSSLARRFHIIRVRQTIRSVTRQCTTCRRWSIEPKPQSLGQLPIERLTPGPVFDKTGLDYAGPLHIKYGHVRKPTTVKAYVCVFVSLTVKAVHLELVTDLTSEAFLACLRRFIARRGYPSLLWSDDGSNFMGTNCEIKEIIDFLKEQTTQKNISEFCSINHIKWKFIPEHSPHFGGIWEAAVKSFKTHLKRIVGNVRLTYEETSTVLTQIEACLNSRPLVPVNAPDDDSIEVLTPGHFLIGQHYPTLHFHIVQFRSFDAGICVNNWYIIFGNDGHWSIYLPYRKCTSGNIHQGACLSVTWYFSLKMKSYPPSGPSQT